MTNAAWIYLAMFCNRKVQGLIVCWDRVTIDKVHGIAK